MERGPDLDSRLMVPDDEQPARTEEPLDSTGVEREQALPAPGSKKVKELVVLPIKVNNKDTKNLIGAGWAKNRRAGKLLEQAIKRSPTAGHYSNLGCSYALSHRFDDAEYAFEKALKELDDPSGAHEAARTNLGVLPDLRRHASRWSQILSGSTNTMSRLRPLIIIGIGLILVLVLLPSPPDDQLRRAATGEVQLPIKVSDLAGGTDLFELRKYLMKVDKYVSLAVVYESGKEGEKEFETASCNDLRVIGLLDDKGRDVANTGATPASILLSVPADKFDAIVKGLQQEKKVAYLLPQGTDMAPTPAPTTAPDPGPTATVATGSVAFSLPADKIQSDLKSLKPGDNVVVIVVVERKDGDGKIVKHKADHHDGATLLDVLDKDSVPLASPYEGATTVHISLPLGTNGDPAVEFAGQLVDASAIYLLPAP